MGRMIEYNTIVDTIKSRINVMAHHNPGYPRPNRYARIARISPHDENPISENGTWLNGRKDGIDSTDVIAKNGVGYGEVTRIAQGGKSRLANAHRRRNGMLM